METRHPFPKVAELVLFKLKIGLKTRLRTNSEGNRIGDAKYFGADLAQELLPHLELFSHRASSSIPIFIMR